MRKTNKELLDFFGLKFGDKIKIELFENEVFEVIDDDFEDVRLKSSGGCRYFLSSLTNKEYEVIKPKKKIGEIRCCDHDDCEDCPLTLFECERCGYWDANWSLYKILNEACASTGMNADHPIYKAFRSELDKEVE